MTVSSDVDNTNNMVHHHNQLDQQQATTNIEPTAPQVPPPVANNNHTTQQQPVIVNVPIIYEQQQYPQPHMNQHQLQPTYQQHYPQPQPQPPQQYVMHPHPNQQPILVGVQQPQQPVQPLIIYSQPQQQQQQQPISPYHPTVTPTTATPTATNPYHRPNLRVAPMVNLLPHQKPILLHSTKFQQLFQPSKLNASSHILQLQNQDSALKYYCCASLGLFRMYCIMSEVAHISILPPIKPPPPSTNGKPQKSSRDIPIHGRSHSNSCCDCMDDCNCNCNGCMNVGAGSGEGAAYALIIMLGILLLLLILLVSVYFISAPIAIFLIMYHEKITTIEFNDEKREIQWTSRARYFRDYSFVFSKHSLSYDSVHDVYPQLLIPSSSSNRDECYCLLVEAKDGTRINISKPLKLNYGDLGCGALYLKDFLSKRGVVFVGNGNGNSDPIVMEGGGCKQQQPMMMTMVPGVGVAGVYNSGGGGGTTSTMPMNHQMV